MSKLEIEFEGATDVVLKINGVAVDLRNLLPEVFIKHDISDALLDRVWDTVKDVARLYGFKSVASRCDYETHREVGSILRGTAMVGFVFVYTEDDYTMVQLSRHSNREGTTLAHASSLTSESPAKAGGLIDKFRATLSAHLHSIA